MANVAREIVVEDVSYRRPPSGDLLARLYRPTGKGPFPAIVSVHGGRWVSQSRLTNEVIDGALARAGIVVMAVDFRMPPVARYPEPVADINFAIRWLKHAAPRLGSSAALVGALGTSSGGHQVLLNALRPHDPRYSAIELPDSQFGAGPAYVAAGWPVLDPLARYKMAKERNMELHVKSHDAYWPDEESMAEGNPQLIVEREEFEEMPPLLVVHGTGDTTVPVEMSKRFVESYRARNGTAKLKTFDDRPHTFITKDPNDPESHRAVTCIRHFILQQAQAIVA